MAIEKEQPIDMGILVWFFTGFYINVLSNPVPPRLGTLLASYDEIQDLSNVEAMLSAHLGPEFFITLLTWSQPSPWCLSASQPHFLSCPWMRLSSCNLCLGITLLLMAMDPWQAYWLRTFSYFSFPPLEICGNFWISLQKVGAEGDISLFLWLDMPYLHFSYVMIIPS